MLPRSKLSIGTMNFGSRTPRAEARKIVDCAIERGATFFDTANVYGDGESERLLGEALKGRRESVSIATKVGFLRRNGRPEGLSAEVIGTALTESLARLGTDYVDVYYLHVPDHGTPLQATLDGLQPLLESGAVKAWGVSNFASWQILELNTLCAQRGMPGPAISQVLYNLLIRQLDVEYFAFARAHPLHTTVYNPLAGGLLAREAAPGAKVPSGSRFERNKLYRGRYWTDAFLEQAGRFQQLARDAGLSGVQLAYAWLAQRPGVDSILAGPGSLQHLEAALEAVTLPLAPELPGRIDALNREFLGTDASYAR